MARCPPSGYPSAKGSGARRGLVLHPASNTASYVMPHPVRTLVGPALVHEHPHGNSREAAGQGRKPGGKHHGPGQGIRPGQSCSSGRVGLYAGDCWCFCRQALWPALMRPRDHLSAQPVHNVRDGSTQLYGGEANRTEAAPPPSPPRTAEERRGLLLARQTTAGHQRPP